MSTESIVSFKDCLQRFYQYLDALILMVFIIVGIEERSSRFSLLFFFSFNLFLLLLLLPMTLLSHTCTFVEAMNNFNFAAAMFQRTVKTTLVCVGMLIVDCKSVQSLGNDCAVLCLLYGFSHLSAFHRSMLWLVFFSYVREFGKRVLWSMAFLSYSSVIWLNQEVKTMWL